MTGVLRRGEADTGEADTGETAVTTEQPGEGATRPGAQGLLAPPLAGRGRKEPPCWFQRVWPCDPLVWDFWPPDSEGVCGLCWSGPVK